jgi:hypothetical protein
VLDKLKGRGISLHMIGGDVTSNVEIGVHHPERRGRGRA